MSLNSKKKLAQRVTEKYCVCERIIETIDESTGEVVNTVTEKVCDDKVTSMSSENSNIVDMIEKKIQDKKISPVSLGLTVLIGIQVIALVYYMFFYVIPHLLFIFRSQLFFCFSLFFKEFSNSDSLLLICFLFASL